MEVETADVEDDEKQPSSGWNLEAIKWNLNEVFFLQNLFKNYKYPQIFNLVMTVDESLSNSYIQVM